MAYSAFAVANAFIERAQDKGLALSPMKLQKLMYYAQAWHLKVLNAPLLDDNFCRWKYGPVIPAVYHEFKAYAYRPISSMATTRAKDADGHRIPTIPEEDKTAWSLIDAIITRYGHIDAQTLSAMTHRAGSAWEAGLNDKKTADGTVITHDQMRADTAV